jgi:DNA polymerase-3 subunit epsilon
VLAHLLHDCEDFEVSTLLDLAPYGLAGISGAILDNSNVPFVRTGKAVSRKQAGEAERESKGSYVADLVRRLRPSSDVEIIDGSLGLYLNLLDQILEDRHVDAHEHDELVHLAQEWDLSQGDVRLAHKTYLGMMVGVALEDDLVTEAEMNDLRAISDLLAIPRTDLISMIETARLHGSDRVVDPPSTPADLSGSSVCFTGQTTGPSGGPISRTEASELAESHGLTVLRNVTKKLDVLVVADPDTQSSKARKARAYGTRILAAPVFWRMIGNL